ncbi:cytochrome P450 [Streptomyces sp. NRRL S-118]|uniref:cytochrome P450 n=1 Tax=Streptomyces sp. NRRL S-118 TaxID=1463881 RepID=UPI000B0F6DA6|nr:cytochrome P450 [Streptomyces sp. NRRL S-118]
MALAAAAAPAVAMIPRDETLPRIAKLLDDNPAITLAEVADTLGIAKFPTAQAGLAQVRGRHIADLVEGEPKLTPLEAAERLGYPTVTRRGAASIAEAELRVRRARPYLQQVADALADAWQPGSEVDMELAMAQYAVETLTATLFSTDIGLPAVAAVREHLPVLLKNLLVRAVSPKALDRLPIRANRDFETAANALRQVIDGVVTTARRDGHTGHGDLLSLLLAAQDPDSGRGLSDVEVRDELSNILFAGVETTAATLAWTFHELATHPDVEKQVVAELREVVGDRPVTIEDVPRLTAIRRVLDEVVRLHGVTLLMRRTIAPVELAGVELPAGTEVAFSLYAVHRDPGVYENPDRFDPDRWLPERQAAAGIGRDTYLPFGAGNRKCIGDAFVYTEATIALATWLAHWQFTPASGHTPAEVASAVAHADRIPMIVTPRC